MTSLSPQTWSAAGGTCHVGGGHHFHLQEEMKSNTRRDSIQSRTSAERWDWILSRTTADHIRSGPAFLVKRGCNREFQLLGSLGVPYNPQNALWATTP
ncbi:hypothetical protein DPEC_G00160650 [Dallia pectoralis]|uniref:Uncharacterized protein n=1 Tax=Dallia pectoralis TaxID=75939 RepID=A0ACC2GGF0_DALPE|nr:hypothetical protein DPEC_G00160650 [Dallia pectoralis]